MTNFVPALQASSIGAAGSLAYFSALFFGFIESEEVLNRLWPERRTISKSNKILRILWFMLIGAVVAFVFQLPEQYLAPIQAFIIGTTWPTIVAQILTSRQAESPQSIKAQIAAMLGKE